MAAAQTDRQADEWTDSRHSLSDYIRQSNAKVQSSAPIRPFGCVYAEVFISRSSMMRWITYIYGNFNPYYFVLRILAWLKGELLSRKEAQKSCLFCFSTFESLIFNLHCGKNSLNSSCAKHT